MFSLLRSFVFALILLLLSLSPPSVGQPTQPTGQPTRQPTRQPTTQPTRQPTSQPTRRPTGQPTRQPTRQPTSRPTRRPTRQPSGQPTRSPTGQPSGTPTSHPTHKICFGCTAGQYFETNVTSYGVMMGCTVCKPGYTCAGGCRTPVACVAGKYSSDYGSTGCTSCPTGKYNHLKASSSCSTCSGGYECKNSTSIPALCPAGRYSPPGSTVCSNCPGGSYSATSGLSACSPCTSGSFCSIGATHPVPCVVGRFAKASSANCTWCSAGFYCPSVQNADVLPCSSGSYSLGGATVCTISPAGYYISAADAPPRICSAGSWSTSGATTCTLASAGSYVNAAGSGSQTTCSQGYWSSSGATSCSACSPGYYCNAGSTSATPTSSECDLGYYCPSSTSRVRCPAGKYGLVTGAKSETEGCTLCPPGYYCTGQTGLASDKVQCPAGYYCAAGAGPDPTICPQGTYSWRTLQVSAATCEVCDKGWFCPSGSTSQQRCPQNFYCPVASGSALPCPSGTYGTTSGFYSASQCSNCTSGHYCPGGVDPISCPIGTFNENMGGSTIFSCAACTSGYACPQTGMSFIGSAFKCPAGYYCPAGTQSLTQFACAAGTYSDSLQLTGQSGCTPCPGGYTCAKASTTAGLITCPRGYYCPQSTATGSELPCPAGKYSSSTGLSLLSQCISCPAGSYCRAASTAISGTCAAGFYCPLESETPNAYPCAAGKYSASTSLSASSGCTTTEKGYYTEAGAASMRPCPAGRFSSVTAAEAAAEGGTSGAPYCEACWAGSYCPSASKAPNQCGRGYYSAALASVCTICPRGSYCSSNTTTSALLASGGGSWAKNTDLSGVCFPGTTCGLGVKTIPTLSTHACSAGYYCTAGSQYPTPCPAGRYNAQTGRGYLGNCTITEAGYYSVSASTTYTGLCVPGYYCPAGSTTPQQLPCPAGTYNAEFGGESVSKCSACPAGSYCPIASSTPLSCPRGYYCPTRTSEPAACRPGSYGGTSGLRAAEECTPCDGGSYCDGYGQQNPRGLCSPGYFCISAANSSSPLDSNTTHAGALKMGTNVLYGRCPRGAYCPLGTILPILCPQGTYNGHEAGKSLQDCAACPPSHYCEGQGNLSPTGMCSAGYFCPGRAFTPTQNQTKAGYFTLAGAAEPRPCSAGSFNNLVAQSACQRCVAGFYCPDAAMEVYADHPCPLGSYCPSGAVAPTNCPPGTYSFNLGLTNVTSCRACDPGMHCSASGLTAVSDPCDSKYYCSSSASSKVQLVATSTGGPCTPGHYCPAGSPAPIPCPVGTYMASVLNSGVITYSGKTFDCTPCGAGRVCSVSGLSASDAQCGAGYWCAFGASQVAASCTDASCSDMFGICPAGHYCPVGSSDPLQCVAGTYQPDEGKALCITCPAGYICTTGSVSYNPCPVNKFCISGSSEGEFCPDGYYSTVTGLSTSQQCLACPAGNYCHNGQVVGLCSAGYFCKSAQSSPTPTIDDSGHSQTALASVAYLLAQKGAQCPAGHYCPEGSDDPTPCRNGTHRADQRGSSQDDCGPCPVGATCLTSSPVAEYCAKGRYCPNAGTQIECPIGSYNKFQGMGFLSDCLDCPAGHYCLATGISNYTVFPCPSGKYCPQGTGRSATVPIDCPEGTFLPTTNGKSEKDCLRCNTTSHSHAHYCPAGSIRPIICPNGYYCWGTGQGFPCPPGSYCPFNSTAPTPCPATYHCAGNASAPAACIPGTYCPYGSPSPISCPLGYKAIIAADNSFSHLHSLQTACVKCPSGKYGTDVNRLVCGLGTPGYVFPLPGVKSAKPTDPITDGGGYECPAGYYCPPGTTAEIPCPPGTFQPEKGKRNFSDCISCAEGAYQYQPASTTCLKCSASSTSLQRSTLCTCIGLNRAFQANDGMCICKPGYEFVDASLVVSSEKDGSYDCQPIVYARCDTGTIRDSSGKCIDEDTYCRSFCGSSGGSVNPSTGTCDCKNLPTVAEVCDETCRNSKPVIKCVAGVISAYDPVTRTTTTATPSSLVSNGAGSIDCSTEGSKVLAMSTDAGKFEGVFGAPRALARRMLKRSLQSAELEHSGALIQQQQQQQQQASMVNITGVNAMDGAESTRQLAGSDPSISNPIVCLKAGDSIIFSVSNANYPIYQKDSLLNTNPNFDYSAFRDLATQASSSQTVSTFPFTFKEEGTYSFKLGSSPSITLISVVPITFTCASDAAFSELSTANLAKLGIKSSADIVLTPQWELLAGLLIGIAGLAVLVASFLYYFRKRAWDWTTHIDVKYRHKNFELGVPSETKGGIWSKGYPSWPNWGGDKDSGESACEAGSAGRRLRVKPTQKKTWWAWLCGFGSQIVTERDMDLYDDELREKEQEAELDTAVIKKNLAETEFEDDMLIPELAKHMQVQHERINKQLVGQKDMMNKLKNVFRKEVDDLKALLESTALEMNSVGGTDVARMRKLRELLKQVRENTVKRGAFEGNLQTGELALKSVCDKLHRSVEGDGGVAGLLASVLQELSISAVQAHARDEPVKTLISPVLHNLLSLTDSFNSLVGIQAQSILDEHRRKETASAALDRSLKISHVAFPDHIFDLMHVCDESYVECDAAVDDIMSIIKAFGDRIPLFLSTVQKCESDIISVINDVLEQSVNAQLEKDQAENTAKLSAYLNEFFGAVTLVTEQMGLRRDKYSAFPRDQGKLLREDLIAAIDNELAMLTAAAVDAAANAQNGMMQQFSNQAVPPASEISRAHSAASISYKAGEEDEEEEQDAAVINNDELTIAQKQEMLDTADTDRQVTDNMIAAQRRAIEEEQNRLVHTGNTLSKKMKAESTDESALKSRSKAQQDSLDQALRKSRDGKLEAMMRVEYFASLHANDSPQDVRVATMAVNRYAVLLRCFALEARAKYDALLVEYEGQKLAAQQARIDAKAGARDVLNLDTDALDDGLEKDQKVLSDKLLADQERAVAVEDAIRVGWQSNPSVVNIDAEQQRLAKECEDRLNNVKSQSSETANKRRSQTKTEGQLKRDLLNSIRSEGEYVEEDVKEISKLLEEEAAASQAAVNAKIEEDARLLTAETDELRELVSFCDSWGPQVPHVKLQSQLFLRVLTGLRATGDVRIRLALTEHQLKSEIQQVRTESEMRKRGASKAEIELTLKNLSDAAAEKAVSAIAAVQSATAQLIAAEQQRQELAVVDFEFERAAAAERGAKNKVLMSLEISRARQTMHKKFQEVLSVKAEFLRGLGDQVAPTLQQLSEKQMRSEVLREELELNASYSTFEIETRVGCAYMDECVLGVLPSAVWAKRVVAGARTLELRLLTEALGCDKLNKRTGREFICGVLRNQEERRLLALGRSASDLTKVYADLDQQLQEHFSLIDSSISREKKQMQSLLDGQADEKIKAHQALEDACTLAAKEEANERARCKAEYEVALVPLKARERSETDAEKLQLAQRLAASLEEAKLKLQNRLFSAYGECLSRLRMIYKLQDELRLRRNEAQQTAAAQDNATDSEAMNAYFALLEQQTGRQRLAKKLRDDYDLELNGLEKVIAAKGDKAKKYLKERLEARRKAREAELVRGGMSPAAAAAKAAEESSLDNASVMQASREEFQQDKRAMQEALKQDVAAQASALKTEYKQAIVAAEQGLAALAAREKEALEAKLKARREARLKELQGPPSNKATAIAKKMVDREFKESDETERGAQSATLENSEANLRRSLDKLYGDLDRELREGYAAEMERVQGDDSLTVAEKQSRTARLSAALKTELEALQEQQRHSLGVLEVGSEAELERERAALLQRLANQRQKRLDYIMETEGRSEKEARTLVDAEEKQALDNLDASVKNAAKANALAAKEDFEARKHEIMALHEAKLHGLDASFAYRQKSGQVSLVERLAKRKDLRERMIRVGAPGLGAAQAASLLEQEMNLLKAQGQQALAKETSSEAIKACKERTATALAKASQSLEREDAQLRATELEESTLFFSEQQGKQSTAIESAARGTREMLDRLQTEALSALSAANDDEEMRRVRRQHEEAKNKLADRIAQQKAQAETDLKQKLAARRATREAELRKQGLSDDAAAKTLESEEAALRAESEQAILAEEATQEALLAKATAEAERFALEKRQEMLAQEAKTKSEGTAAAVRQVEDLKATQEAEFKRLLAQQRADRESNDRALKARLAQKKEARLKALAERQASEQEVGAAMAQIAEEQHTTLVEAERERKEAEQRRVAALQREQAQALAALEAESQRLEMEASLAASKAAMLATLQENKARAEQELAANEIKRLRDAESLESQRHAEEEARVQGQQKGKLADRLKAKREKKEAELRAQEDKAKSMLASRLQAEADQRERQREARELWMPLLEQASQKADDQGLTGDLREETVLHGVFTGAAAANFPVPLAQYSDVVELALQMRHREEAAKLVSRLGGERIAALKAVTDAVAADKSKARMALIEQLNAQDPPLTPDSIDAETKSLDETFSRRQMDEEARVGDSLDPRELKAKMDLKEKQMGEVVRLARLWAVQTSAAASAAGGGGSTIVSAEGAGGAIPGSAVAEPSISATSKSAAEELAEYRAALEEQKASRREALLRQRQEEEEALRREGEVKKRAMQEALEADLRRAEEDAEAQRRALEANLKKQKDELDRRQAEDQTEEHRAEAERKKAEFEKEHAAALENLEIDKSKGRARLQDRLNKRKGAVVGFAAAGKTDEAAAAATASGLPAQGSANAAGGSSSSGSDAFDFAAQAASATDAQSAVPGQRGGGGGAAAAAAGPMQQQKRHRGEGGAADPAALRVLTNTMGQVQLKLDRLEKLLGALDGDKLVSALAQQAGATAAGTDAGAGAVSGVKSYEAPDEPVAGPELVEVRSEDLHVVEKSRLEFADQLASVLGLSRLRIKAASSLPESRAVGNAYRGSYLYKHGEGTLYVHLKRLERSGDVGTIMIHALSHIKANPLDMSNDNDPAFLAVFYRSLGALSQETFKRMGQPSGSNNANNTLTSVVVSAAGADLFGASAGPPPGPGALIRRGSSIGSAFPKGDSPPGPGALLRRGSSALLAGAARGGSGKRMPAANVSAATSSVGGAVASGTESSAAAAAVLSGQAASISMAQADGGTADYSDNALIERMRAYASSSAGAAIPIEFLDKYASTRRL